MIFLQCIRLPEDQDAEYQTSRISGENKKEISTPDVLISGYPLTGNLIP
jgi:hypothetical protein